METTRCVSKNQTGRQFMLDLLAASFWIRFEIDVIANCASVVLGDDVDVHLRHYDYSPYLSNFF